VPATIFVTTGFLDGSVLWFDFARRAVAAARQAGARLPAGTRGRLRAALGRWPSHGRNPEWAVEQLKGLAPAARQQLLDELAAADLPLAPPARPLAWSQVRELAAGGIDIGCHTVSHPILSQLPMASQVEEIAGARDRIRQEIGAAPSTFAFPNGGVADFTAATCDVLRATGFVASCTMVRGGNLPGCDLLRLRRIGIGSDPELVLGARLSGVFDELRRLLHVHSEELA
jgi:peptidoglycan/xylan/chitin deacetylase (PgdA/CDA1 family)